MKRGQLTRLLFFQGDLVVKKRVPESRLMKEAREGKLNGKFRKEDEVKRMILELVEEHDKSSLVEEEEQDEDKK